MTRQFVFSHLDFVFNQLTRLSNTSRQLRSLTEYCAESRDFFHVIPGFWVPVKTDLNKDGFLETINSWAIRHRRHSKVSGMTVRFLFKTLELRDTAVDQKHLESFEMWCWRRMEKISWIDHVRNEEVLFRVKEERNILHEIRKRMANWIFFKILFISNQTGGYISL